MTYTRYAGVTRIVSYRRDTGNKTEIKEKTNNNRTLARYAQNYVLYVTGASARVCNDVRPINNFCPFRRRFARARLCDRSPPFFYRRKTCAGPEREPRAESGCRVTGRRPAFPGEETHCARGVPTKYTNTVVVSFASGGDGGGNKAPETI